jgi:cytochrome b involved in lipid metabolism
MTFPLPDSAQRVSVSTSGDSPSDSSGLSIGKGRKARLKVVLEPGHSALDWARLKSSGKNLSVSPARPHAVQQQPPPNKPVPYCVLVFLITKGVNYPGKYTLSDIQLHNKEGDVWISIQGKIYNIAHYFSFHPGGKPLLMSVAGKDATKQFCK